MNIYSTSLCVVFSWRTWRSSRLGGLLLHIPAVRRGASQQTEPVLNFQSLLSGTDTADQSERCAANLGCGPG